MIKFIKHADIDMAKWDACIQQASNSLIYGYSWYLDIACKNWHAIVLGDYDAVMPLPTNKKIFTMAYQPFFTQQLGIFFKEEFKNKANTIDFFEQIPNEYKYINICLNEQNETGNIGKLGYTLKKRNNYLLYLHQPYQKLFNGFNEHNRRNIKKATKNSLIISDTMPNDVVEFYIKHKGDNTQNVTSADYDRLKLLLNEAQKNGMLLCKQISNEQGECLTSAAFFKNNNRLIYQLGSTNQLGRELRAMYHLFDHIIETHSEQNMVLDFEGSDIENVARFFKNFGALLVPYHRLIANKLPWPFNLIKK